ncbi:hypothetical protein PU01_20995 [Hafnia alvei]|nr:hypothetical protein PU01_20995 [Hafnia alvei]
MIKKSQKLNFTAQKTAEIVAIRITISRYEPVIIQSSECSQRCCGFNGAEGKREMTVVNLQPYKG